MSKHTHGFNHYAVLIWVLALFGLLSGSIIWLKPLAIMRLRTQPPATTRLMEIREKAALKKHESYRTCYHWVPLYKIAKPLQTAVLAAEDDQFFEHAGLDWKEIWRSAQTNLQRRQYALGGSTLTQQVAKNLFLSPRKTMARKIHEAALALEMNWLLPKARVLEIYLNIAEWGRGIFGAEAAARFYYKKSAQDLSPSEAIDLVAVLPSPLRHSPIAESRYLTWRRAWVRQHLPQDDMSWPAEGNTATSSAIAGDEPADEGDDEAEAYEEILSTEAGDRLEPASRGDSATAEQGD